nr:transposase, mutator type [Tanacetum cinerariifolium]GEX11057.1 transposase, mutator type [Tanacetum cinerariifolium]
MAGGLHQHLVGLTLVDRSSVNVVDTDEFCLHDLKDMSLNIDADVLEMSKDVKDYKIILVYVKHGSSNVDTSMFDIIPGVNRNVKKEWKSSVARAIVVETVVDPFDGLDEILGDYANTGKQIIGDQSTWKQMLVYVGTSSTADGFSFGKFKEVEVEADTESKKEEIDIEGNDTSGSDSEDLDYDPKHDDVLDDYEHIVKEVHVNMNNFSFTADPKHDTSIGVVDVQEDDLDVIDYDTFGSDLDDGIDSKRRIQLRKLRRLDKQKNKGFKAYGREILGLDGCFMPGPWPSQILTAVGVDANNEIYTIAYAIVEAKSKAFWCWFLNLLGEDLGIEANFNYTLIFDRKKPKATSEGEFKKKMGELKSFNSDAYEWKWYLTRIPCKHVVAALYNMSENSVGVGIPEQWVHAAYRLETPPKKRKKSNDEIASQSASSGKLYRKAKSVSCGKCGNVGHNRKGCRGQGDGSSQAGARKASG